MSTINILSVNTWDDVSYWSTSFDETYFFTPNKKEIHLSNIGCNYYGNPSYRLYLKGDDWEKLCKIKSSERIGRLYRNSGYLYFTSYNVGYELEILFKKCDIITDLESHTLNKDKDL